MCPYSGEQNMIISITVSLDYISRETEQSARMLIVDEVYGTNAEADTSVTMYCSE